MKLSTSFLRKVCISLFLILFFSVNSFGQDVTISSPSEPGPTTDNPIQINILFDDAVNSIVGDKLNFTNSNLISETRLTPEFDNFYSNDLPTTNIQASLDDFLENEFDYNFLDFENSYLEQLQMQLSEYLIEKFKNLIVAFDVNSRGEIFYLTFANGVFKYNEGDDDDPVITSDKFESPIDLLIDNEDRILIADNDAYSVKVFEGDSSYELMFEIGGSQGADGNEFYGPTGLAVDKQNRIYIADTYPGEYTGNDDPDENIVVDKIKIYTITDSDFVYLNFVGKKQLDDPFRLAVDQDYNLYVSDSGGDNGRIRIFDSGGDLRRTIASDEEHSPASIGVDSFGYIYVADYDADITFNGIYQNPLDLLTKFDVLKGETYAVDVYAPLTNDFNTAALTSFESNLKLPLDLTLNDCGNIFVLDLDFSGTIENANFDFDIELFKRNDRFQVLLEPIDEGEVQLELKEADFYKCGPQPEGEFSIIYENEDILNPTFDCPDEANLDPIFYGNDCSITVPEYDISNIQNFESEPFLVQSYVVNENTVSATIEVFDGEGGELVGTCNFEVDLVDTQKPILSDCPPDNIEFIIPDGTSIPLEDYRDQVVVEDNCSTGLVPVQDPAPGTSISEDQEVTLIVTDEAGNVSDVCSFTVTITEEAEDTPPEFDNCSTTTITKSNDPGVCGAIVRFDNPTASDENGNVEVTRIDDYTDLVSGSLFPVGTTTIIFQADDGTNDPVICSFDIIVQDTEAPVLTCKETRIVEAEPGETSAVVNFILPPARDGCDGILPTRISDGSMASGSRFPIGTTNIVFEATDQANNTGYCTLQIRVLAPKSPPEFDNCSTTTITKSNDPGECGAVVRFDTPTASDENGNVEVTRIDANTDLVSGSLFPVGTTTIILQADDGTNDPVTCSFDIIVQDTEAPELTCVPDITAQASPGNDSKSINFSLPTARDVCDGVLQSRVSEGSLVSGSNFPIGSTDVVFEATDSNGNIGYCTLNVNILPPNYAPSIACPADISVPNDGGICGALVEFADPTMTDPEDDNLTITRTDDSGLNSGDIFPVGTTTIVYQVSDGINPPVSCDFTITVEDTEQPQFSSCPENMTELLSVSESGKIIFFDLPQFADNCSEAELFQTAGPSSGKFFPAGETEVRFELRANNTVVDQCSFTVDLVRQTESFQCIESITINLGEEAQNSSVTEIPTSEFILSDSSNLDFELNVQQFTCEDIGTFDLPIRATDVTTGEELSCTVEVTVLDRGAPLIICPAGIQEREIPANGNFVLPQIADRLSIIDNCADFEDLEIIQNPPEGTLYTNAGDYEVSITATDPAGNTEVCQVTYRLTREEQPEEFALNCPQNENVIKADENCEFFVPDFSNLIDYSPANATFSQSIPVGTKIEEQTVITVTASFNGESDSCTFDLVLKDNTPPVVNCPADKTIVISEGESIPIADYRNDLEVGDNCGVGEITQVPEPGTPISEDTEVSFLVFDSASTANAAVCSFMLTLSVDNEGNDIPVANEDFYSTPVNTTLNISAEEGVLANDMDADGDELTATLVEDVTNGTLEFNSDGSYVYTPNNDFVGEESFRYYVFDGFTEVETTVTINVFPVDSGEFQCVENYLLELDENGTAQLPVTDLYTGDASGVSFSLDQEFFDCNDLGINQVILSYSGEVNGACEIRVEVVDRIQPEFEVQNIGIDLDLSGNAIITAEDVVVNFRDNCDETINFELSRDSFSCKDLGWNEINVIATDASGNSRTTSVEVQVFAESGICNGTGEGSEYIFIYPNPNRGNFKVATPADVSISRIEVFDHRGRFIIEKDFPENASEYAISTGPLQEAVYVVKMITNEGEKTKRFIIKN